MSGLAHYFAMGGYAGFIWPSYGLALLLLIGMAVAAFRRMRAAEIAIRQAEAAASKAAGKTAGKTGRADRNP
jgi:heme exporter protein D